MKTRLLKRLRRKVRRNLRIVKWRTLYRVEEQYVDALTGLCEWKSTPPPFFDTIEEAKKEYNEIARRILLMELFEYRKVVYK